MTKFFAAAAFAVACLGLAAVSASTVPAGSAASVDRSGLVPRRAFVAQTNLVEVEIAPSGRLVAFLKREGRTQSVWLLDSESGVRRQLAQHNEATALHWSTDSRSLFLQSDRALTAVDVANARDGGVMSLLGEKAGRSVLGVDRSQPGAMLVQEEVRRAGERKPFSYRILRLRPGQPVEQLFASAEPVDEFVPGQQSYARIIVGDHFSIVRVARPGPPREVLRCVRLEQCSLLSVSTSGDLLLSGDLGGDRERLLRLGHNGTLETIHEDPRAISDLDSVALDPATGEALVASYRSAAAADYAIAARAAVHVDAIGRQLAPGSAFKLGAGKTHWLVAETGDRLQHPRWHLYDPASRRLRPILADVEASARDVDAAVLADRVPVSFRASDGATIHGFVAVPSGTLASSLPLVVNVHGGPWSHVVDGYTTITQFLVSRGYAVFEPNFRGSTGYGRTYTQAGKQGFGNGRVQQDIVEGTQYLLAHGIGDPARVGIIGSSFGGYSALQGVTFAPHLFRVAVAGMPPPDFGWVMRWQVQREAIVGHSGIGLANSLKQLEIDTRDAALFARLSAQSPLSNARRLHRPLLIIAGAQDQSVPIRSIVDYAARLKTLGRRVTLFVDPKSGHRVDDPEVQEQYLFLLSTMLHAHLGGKKEPPLDTRNSLKLSRKLRIDDWALGSKAGRS